MNTNNNNNELGFLPSPIIETTDDSMAMVFRKNDPISNIICHELGLSDSIVPVGAVGEWQTGIIGLKRVCSALLQNNLRTLLEISTALTGAEQEDSSPCRNLDIKKLLVDVIGFKEEDLNGDLAHNLCVKRLGSTDIKDLNELAMSLTKCTSYFMTIKKITSGDGDVIKPEYCSADGLTLGQLQDEVEAQGGVGFPHWTGDTDFFGWSGDIQDLKDGLLNEVSVDDVGALRSLPHAIAFAGKEIVQGEDKATNVISMVMTLADGMHDDLRELAWQKYPSPAFNSNPTSRADDLRSYSGEMKMSQAKGHGAPTRLVDEGLSPVMRSNGFITLADSNFKEFSDLLAESTGTYPTSSKSDYNHEEVWSAAIASMTCDLMNCLGYTHAAIVNYFLAAYKMKPSLGVVTHSDEMIKKHGLFPVPPLTDEQPSKEIRNKIHGIYEEIIDSGNKVGKDVTSFLVATPFILDPIFSTEALAEVATNDSKREDFIELLKLELLPTLSLQEIEVEVECALNKLASLIERGEEVESPMISESKSITRTSLEVNLNKGETEDVTEALQSGSKSILSGSHHSSDWRDRIDQIKGMLARSKKDRAEFTANYESKK